MKDKEYIQLLTFAKEQIKLAQIKTLSVANSQMLLLYWQMGRLILENQNKQGWGAKVIQLLSVDLRKEFPNIKGFSARNMLYMKQFAQAYSLETIRVYNTLEIQLRDKNNLTQTNVQLLLKVDNELTSITQQAVALLKNNHNIEDKITQQPVAQIQDSDNQTIEIIKQPVAQLEENDFLSSIIAKIQWSHHGYS